MADFLWALSTAQLPESLFDWQRILYGLQIPLEAAERADLTADLTNGTPRLAVWTFNGDQPMAAGLAALFGEYFRWLGPTFEFVSTRFEEDADGQLSWTPDMMQVDPTTFMPDALAAYPKVWGNLAVEGLDVHFTNPATPDGDEHTWSLTGSMIQIVPQLTGLVAEVLSRLGVTAAQWQPEEALDIDDNDALMGLLRAWGELNIRHELIRAGFEEYSDALQGAIRRMGSAALTGSRFACWLACRALWPVAADERAPHQADAEEALINLASIYPRVAWPGIALSLLEWGRGDYNRAGDLLETAVESDPRALQGWQLLALLYEELGQTAQAIKVCREAVSGNVADATIYYNLGRLLLDQSLESDDENRSAVEEALSMFQQAEQHGLHSPELALRMMDAYEALEDESGLWTAFEKLIKADRDGGVLWQVIEEADSYDDFEPGLALLRQSVADKSTSQADAYEPLAALTRALIVLDRHPEALQMLPQLRKAADDDYARAEAAQLALEATAPDFEDAYGEIVDEIEAGQLPDSSIMSLLTDALQREPSFADGAVTLAQGYQLQDNPDAALQIIEQTRALLPDHLELVLSLADIQWSTDQDEVALQTIHDALEKHPDDVALLARLGEYYFEIREDDTAREYLSRAEALEPRHPELMRVREQISRDMAALEDDDDTDDETDNDNDNEA